MSKTHDITDLSGEEWRPVEGWPYEVSSFGRVRRSGVARGTRAGKILSGRPLIGTGYLRVNLSKNCRRSDLYIHSLVCSAFRGPRPSGYFACHLDGNPTNNRASNLRWQTRAENSLDMVRHGRSQRGEKTKGHLLTSKQVREIRQLYAECDYSYAALAAEFGVTPGAIGDVIRRTNWYWLSD